MSNSVAT
ncbi:hypothetical protein TrLO_g13220, partial [Triparma laevis f. longispina]